MYMVVLALGCNIGASEDEKIVRFQRALQYLADADCRLIAASRLYQTPPLGGGLQQKYLNAVAVFDRAPPPRPLLQLLKRIERAEGRRYGRRWGPRLLDIDLLLHGARVTGWPLTAGQRRPHLVLPHPELHKRGFVLVPMADVERAYGRALIHPVFGLSMEQLCRRRQGAGRGISLLDAGLSEAGISEGDSWARPWISKQCGGVFG